MPLSGDTTRAKVAETDSTKTGSMQAAIADSSSITHTSATEPILNKLLLQNRFLNVKSRPVYFIQNPRPESIPNTLFYFVFGLVLFFGIIKSAYAKYFGTLWRVFFNTSMRQSQLSEQLKQANQPSMFFNIFFMLAAAWYITVLLLHYDKTQNRGLVFWLGISTLGIFILYGGKYLFLKFIGWVSGYKQEADNYIFIVFLINKVLAICLLPLIIVIGFASASLAYIAVISSLVVIGLMLLLRFVRSYGTFRMRFQLSSLHFLMYVAGFEIIPLLVLYKLALMYLSEKL
jgi:hypothetical protein